MSTEIKDPVQKAGKSLMTLPKETVPNSGSPDLEGSYCIHTDEYNCGCRERPWRYIHCNKKIVVWDNNDDDSILNVAKEMKALGINPRIIEYKVQMGKAIHWDDIESGTTLG